MKTYDAEKPDACWELAKETLAAYRQKRTPVPVENRARARRTTDCASRRWSRRCDSLGFALGCIP